MNKTTIDHPSHYNKGNIEVIDVIEDWKLGFNLGNAIKYIARADYKENRQQDLKKALWYLEREISSTLEEMVITELDEKNDLISNENKERPLTDRFFKECEPQKTIKLFKPNKTYFFSKSKMEEVEGVEYGEFSEVGAWQHEIDGIMFRPSKECEHYTLMGYRVVPDWCNEIIL